MNLQETIGKVLVQRRRDLNMSQVDLSKSSGVCRRYLSDIENGTRSVSVNVLKNLTDNLQWTLADLFIEVESFNKKEDPILSENVTDGKAHSKETPLMSVYNHTPEI